MRPHVARGALAVLLGASILSCSRDLTPPRIQSPTPPPRAASATVPVPQLVISQVYGGGGNSGSTWTNDFIEIFNPGSQPVSLSGWSVQYASSGGTTWAVTKLTGTIPPGGYHLVQEARGAGGTTPMPAYDDSGAIAMSASDGKVALVSSTSAVSGTCPSGPVDQVAFGGATWCSGSNKIGTLSAIKAGIRNDAGCAYTGDLAADFTVAAPTPRNAQTAVHVCPNTLPLGPLDHVAIAGASTVIAGASIQLAASAQDANNQTIGGLTFTWASSDAQTATVDATGKVTGMAASPTPVTITATATDATDPNNVIVKSGSALVTVNAPGINWIDVTSSATSFPPGFQTQLFATARVSSGGAIVPASFTFAPADPTIATVATVQNTAIVTGVAGSSTKPGIIVTATPIGGGTPYTFTAHPVTIEDPAPASTSIYATNDEFGDPTAASASDPNDLLIVRPQYTLSYNESRGTPNWVSYELDARQMVAGQDRCNCFTADPLLPAAAQIFTSDYTSGGFDRGHMTRSADRTAGNTDNASTFYLTNVVPQMADLNQGVWAQFENALADSANKGGRAVYIITGPLFSRSHGLTFLKNEGKVAVPDSTWKVAVIGPRNGGVPFTHGDIRSWSDLDGVTVLAVNMPNVNGVRNDPWQKYLTTIDRIEAATGYDFLSLLPSAFQDAVEAGDHAPVPGFSTSGALQEGASITFDASASTDPDLGRTDLGRTEALTYSWHFSDGATATGPLVTHAFSDNGAYTATLTVADAFGWQESTVQTVQVSNVAPVVTLAAASPLTIFSGDHFAVSGGFTDPGADSPWQALIDWGTGATSPSTWSASGATIADSSVFLAIGTYAVKLRVADKDGGVGSATVGLDVLRRPVPGQALPNAIDAAETDGDILVTLSSAPLADVSTLDTTSVSIGGVGLSAGKKVKVKDQTKGAATITLRFARRELIDAGLLTPSTTELVVTGALTGGVQIVAHVPVNVH